MANPPIIPPPPGTGRCEFDAQWAAYWLPVQAVGPLTYTRYRLLLAELPHALPTAARVLDVGCGPGVLLGLIAGRHPDIEVFGVEFSATALQHAPVNLRPRIVCGDILNVAQQFTAQSFDLIVCSEVLEHVPDPGAVVNVLGRLAKPGAILLFSVPAGMRHWSTQDEAAGHLRRFEVDEFRTLLANAGLHIDKLYTWGGPVSWIYNRAINHLGPARAARSGESRSGRLVARWLTRALRIDDLWRTRRGFQLIARARHREVVR